MTALTKQLTNAELRQIIDSHEKGHAMVVPINCDYLAAKELLGLRKAQPVFFIEIEGDDWINAGRVPGSTFDFSNLPDGINHLYAAPPAPALPGELLDAMAEVIRISDRDHEAWDRAKVAISACRVAMLTAAPTIIQVSDDNQLENNSDE